MGFLTSIRRVVERRRYDATMQNTWHCPRCGRIAHVRQWSRLVDGVGRATGMVFYFGCTCGHVFNKVRHGVVRIVDEDRHRKYLAA